MGGGGEVWDVRWRMEGVGALSQESEAAAAQLKKREALVPIKSHYCRLERRGAAASTDMSGCWGRGYE